MAWLDDHLENFVEPVVPNFVRNLDRRTQMNYFSQQELTVIKNAWRSVKKNAQGKRILLAGRDVFIFEILAQRERYPTFFVPECSRMTVHDIAKLIPDPDTYFLFDTGFAGSIPRGLRMDAFKMLSAYENTQQIFPRLSFSRGLALRIEHTPKYWSTGHVDADGNVSQSLSSVGEFERAARLTIEIYTNSASRFIKKHQPMGGGR